MGVHDQEQDMRLVEALTREQLEPIYKLYLDAFPEIERKPIPLIEEKVAEGTSQVFSILDQDEFVGFAMFVVGEDKVLLDFFAISPEKRCGGYGSRVFPLFWDYYKGKKFLLEIEDPNATDVEEEELSLRRRRKAFYLRQGMQSMPFLIDLFGVEMEVLTNGYQVDFPEYHGLIRGVYGPIIDEKILFVRYLDGREGGPMMDGRPYPKESIRIGDQDAGWEVCNPL